ncbi:hypothetical protein DFR50_111151 [Roseiarcus fermentans]|uniref:Secreted protein with PEP-CTERM sorting signal n=1 Tax=Roseiarcus fermentans TaxID=1473586 RepID=A0A366FJJ8_9HYPH|nr:hypothetical protein [Roseiarcus fermentans]RBP13889.1 hypothetical protein DFR50_111151 [Roseiarcus fermentans]
MNSTIMPTIALAAFAFGAASQARADVWWTLENVTFDDGGTATGSFMINVDDYSGGGQAATTAGATLGGYTYDYVTTNNPTDDTMYFQLAGPYEYARGMALTFAHPLTTAIDENDIIGASSWECAGYSCPGSGTIRYVTGGYAVAPEAPTWAMMILGAGLLGFGGQVLRGRARLRAA